MENRRIIIAEDLLRTEVNDGNAGIIQKKVATYFSCSEDPQGKIYFSEGRVGIGFGHVAFVFDGENFIA